MTENDKIFICVDSGGTKSISCAVNPEGHILGVGHGGPTNAIFVPEPDAIFAVREAVLGSLGQHTRESEPVPEVVTVYLSAPGFSSEAAERALRPICPNARIIVEGDAFAAFRGAIPFGDGLVALSGTGSFACALWGKKWRSIGGWGPLLGDEGSGYWIGVEALKAVTLAADKRGPQTSLQTIFRRTLHYSFDEELRRLVYSDTLNRQRIAGLTLLVNQAAKEGDSIARTILTRAGRELSLMTRDLARQMELDNVPITVSAIGGVVRHGSLVLESFCKNIEEYLPKAKYSDPLFEPWVGAILRTIELSGVTVNEEVTNCLTNSVEKIVKPA